MGSKISKTGLKPLCSGRKARGKRTRKIQVEPAGSARREAESGREEEAGRASRAETPRVIDLESEDEAEQLCREDSEESCAEVRLLSSSLYIPLASIYSCSGGVCEAEE